MEEDENERDCAGLNTWLNTMKQT